MELVTLTNNVAELSGVVNLTSADVILDTDGRDCSFKLYFSSKTKISKNPKQRQFDLPITATISKDRATTPPYNQNISSSIKRAVVHKPQNFMMMANTSLPTIWIVRKPLILGIAISAAADLSTTSTRFVPPSLADTASGPVGRKISLSVDINIFVR